MSDTPIVGIDLGTTNSLIGVMDTGFPVLIPGQNGSRLLPSVVSWAGDRLIVGEEARRRRAAFPRDTLYSVKRFIGRPYQDLRAEELDVAYPVKRSSTGLVELHASGKAWRPQDVSAEVLSHLKSRAEEYLKGPVSRAVITVPAYFNDGQRTATLEAGKKAGLQVERLLNEPTAAALAFGLDRKSRRVAVYDLGGGTFDLSILEMRDGFFQVLSTHGNTRLGGDDIDGLLAQELIRRLAQQTSKPLDAGVRARLMEAAEQAKCRLSFQEEITIELPFLLGDFSFQTLLTQAELQALARPVIDKTRAHCLRALADAKVDSRDLDEVILVGGQTRMPYVQKIVAEIFEKEPNTSINPDEAVALGAVIQGGILSGAIQNMTLLDVIPLSLGIETFGGLMNVMIPRNSSIPTKAGEQFTNAVDGQKSVLIHVLQGERELVKDNWDLGQFELPFAPLPRGKARVGVQFEVDANGILHVLARDIATGVEKRVQMKSTVDVSDEAVERMVSESVDFAFDDMKQRRLVELRQKAASLAEVTQKVLSTLGEKITLQDKAAVAFLLQELERASQGEDEGVLTKAIENLDQGTISIAEKLMELSIEEHLKK